MKSVARRAKSGARKVMAIVEIVPATKEPTAAVARAAPPRPALAIGKPSMVVATDEDSPGVLSRIEVVEPPYIPP